MHLGRLTVGYVVSSSNRSLGLGTHPIKNLVGRVADLAC